MSVSHLEISVNCESEINDHVPGSINVEFTIDSLDRTGASDLVDKVPELSINQSNISDEVSEVSANVQNVTNETSELSNILSVLVANTIESNQDKSESIDEISEPNRLEPIDEVSESNKDVMNPTPDDLKSSNNNSNQNEEIIDPTLASVNHANENQFGNLEVSVVRFADTDTRAQIATMEHEPVVSETRRKFMLLKQGILFIPKWCVIMSVLVFVLILTILAAALIIVFIAPPPAAYGENCLGRSCTPGMNLSCINKTCTCTYNFYYEKKCVQKKEYLEYCSQTNFCKDGSMMNCLDGVCKCYKTQYWDGTICINRRSYRQMCHGDECLIEPLLYCNKMTNTCLCDSTRYWEGSGCMLLRTINETCTNTDQCMTKQKLSCINGLCICLSNEYWSIINNICMNKKTENVSCSFNYECHSAMKCTTLNICQCELQQYFDNLTSTCRNQVIDTHFSTSI